MTTTQALIRMPKNANCPTRLPRLRTGAVPPNASDTALEARGLDPEQLRLIARLLADESALAPI
ncbi:MAG: hypothetical protein JO147_10785 [Actinobacteria bacterium]|nr:hypothetical protein [Actinomycetota bacterium]